MEFFGLTIKRKEKKEKLQTFQVEPDVSVDVSEIGNAGVVSYNYDLVTVPENEIELIRTYRRIAVAPEIDLALNEIRNEVFVFDALGKRAIEVGFAGDSKISASIRKKITEEFINLYNLIDFQNRGISYFMDWYIDGKMFMHKIIDNAKPSEGIKKVVVIDPLKIKKVRELPKADKDGIYNTNDIKEYYVYSDQQHLAYNRNAVDVRGLKIHLDAVSYSDSGIYDRNVQCVLGNLYKAIIPFNNLRMMEDSLVIYRVSRAPERRVIYVDVGNLPKNKAEQYVRDLMNRFKNRLVYDSKTGSIADRKNVLSMIEDYWLPRRDGGRGTEISTLPGGENLGVTEDVNYFRNKLYQALNVPISRFRDDAPSFMFGRGVEINRDEYRFKKFIDRQRQRFMLLFEDLLKTQLILKKIIAEGEWQGIKRDIVWEYAEDNNFVEYKESEVLNSRLATLQQIEAYEGKYYTRDWILKNVVRLTDNEMRELNAEYEKNKEDDDRDGEGKPREDDDGDGRDDGDDVDLNIHF